MTGSMQLDSFVYGLISAASLPLGAALALVWKPGKKVTAALMAFGGGALLAALTIDLVAETVDKGEFFLLAAGCIIGGVLYELLNHMLNMQGGFLRKRSTTMKYLRRKKIRELKILFGKIGVIRFLRHLPHDEIYKLLPYINKVEVKNGEKIFSAGEPGDEVFVVESGEIAIIDEKDKVVQSLRINKAWGELRFLKNEKHTDTAVAIKDSVIWLLHKQDLMKVASHSPRIAAELEHYVKVHIDQSEAHDEAEHNHENFTSAAIEHAADPGHHDVASEGKKHSNAALAIWLGILLDGIPESFVIGASFLVVAQSGQVEASAGLSLSLLAGLFLSNFPESLSSSVEMRENKYSKTRIMLMWGSLMLITGLGALLGNFILNGASPTVFPVIEGLAAGAMLTMIAETMLPEAYEKGGTVTGLSTLLGFLSAILFKEIG